ncbi:MAG: hypothetical protein ACRC8P_00295 [Spiroplasma sp.]
MTASAGLAGTTETAKGVGKFLNPKGVTTGKANYQKKIDNHFKTLVNKRNNEKMKYNSQIKDNIKNMKEFVKSRQNY